MRYCIALNLENWRMDRGNGDAFLNPGSSQGINEMCIAFSKPLRRPVSGYWRTNVAWITRKRLSKTISYSWMYHASCNIIRSTAYFTMQGKIRIIGAWYILHTFTVDDVWVASLRWMVGRRVMQCMAPVSCVQTCPNRLARCDAFQKIKAMHISKPRSQFL